MKKSHFIKLGLALLVTLSVGSYLYLCSLSIDPQATATTLELAQTSADHLSNASERFHQVAAFLQRILAR